MMEVNVANNKQLKTDKKEKIGKVLYNKADKTREQFKI